MESKPLENIAVTVHERKWMRSGHCWRVLLALPSGDEILAPLLSGMIGTKVRAELRGAADVDIDPAEILDVPCKGKCSFLVMENCYETQNGIGPALTVLSGSECKLTLVPVGEAVPPKPEPTTRGDVTDKTLRGLHLAFFQNRAFWKFVAGKVNEGRGWDRVEIGSAEECKARFKALAQVQSCTELSEGYVRSFIWEFNQFINGGRA